MYSFIDHSKRPDFDWDMRMPDSFKMVEVIRPILFFARGQKITRGKLSEYFTEKAIIKFEGDDFIKFL